jgi:hypothetical protein
MRYYQAAAYEPEINRCRRAQRDQLIQHRYWSLIGIDEDRKGLLLLVFSLGEQ